MRPMSANTSPIDTAVNLLTPPSRYLHVNVPVEVHTNREGLERTKRGKCTDLSSPNIELRPVPGTGKHPILHRSTAHEAILMGTDSREGAYLPLYTTKDDVPSGHLNGERLVFGDPVQMDPGVYAHGRSSIADGGWRTVRRKAPPEEEATPWRTPAPRVISWPTLNFSILASKKTWMSP